MSNEKIASMVVENDNLPNRPPSPKQNCSNELKLLPNSAVAFFIGGAGDKETYYMAGPYRNIETARIPFNKLVQDLADRHLYRSYYLGYNDVRGYQKINANVISRIPRINSPIYIVGHSLGGWNGAHLSRVLGQWKHNVEMLITLDPVGEGGLVWLGSDIYCQKPKPKAKVWINVLAKPSKPDESDAVADFGERWIIPSGPDINKTADLNHYDAKRLFFSSFIDEKSPAMIMQESIRGLTEK